MSETLHLFVTDEGDNGWSVESPQVPGFIMGRPTMAELKADLPDALRFAGASWARLETHMVRRFDASDHGEYLIRVAEDVHRGDRLQVAWRLEAVMATEQRRDLLGNVPTPTGEVSFVCAVASDVMGWFSEQLFDSDDTFTIAAAVADEGVYTTQVTSNVGLLGHGWASLETRGWTSGTPLSEVIRTMAAQRPGDRLLVAR